MGDSFRIRTEIGINKTINVELEQRYNSLEILSLKIQQEDLYNLSCANYGVVIGRVTANNGFGIPNAKVSIFIPIQDQDVDRPEITAIYPYKSPEQKNEDGFRYNLLPYDASYTGHVPTGTFPSIRDTLTDKTAIEIFDKYYKYTVKTNSSGDYMIMGVPLGVQVVFLDIDLSDIGEFSLTPQDLIRMGRATESQVAGRFFKSSNNLNSLPQIVSLTKSIDVSPLWGDPGTCQAAINRVDFDLRDDANIDIQPTAVFMGSIISSPESEKVKRRCKPTKKLGELCGLVAGPGQILSIRQTINSDEYGRPILEQFRFDGGDDVIDSNGVWLVDLPMNLDYVTINEFGERILSNDPKVGIPTKAKYRFKIKWKQPDDLSQSIKRAYYLVPNVREYGWTTSASDPKDSTVQLAKEQFNNSYAFSLDWNEYGDTGTTVGRSLIQTAINCEDKFYEFRYNQVYTVAGLVDLYQRGVNKDRYIGIKNILNDSCESTNYKFPTNDSVKNRDILFTLLNVLMVYTFFTFNFLIPVGHILGLIWPIFKVLYFVVFVTIQYILYGLCKLIDLLPFVSKDCNKPASVKETWNRLKNPFVNIPLPMMLYPDCDFCQCQQETVNSEDTPENQSAQNVKAATSLSCLINTTGSQDFSNFNSIDYCANEPFFAVNYQERCAWIEEEVLGYIDRLMAGVNNDTYANRTPQWLYPPQPETDGAPISSQDLTLSERLNLFNLKGKYFDDLRNQGGGLNQIKVKINPTGNTNPNTFHYDNVLAILIDPACADGITTGNLITFNDPDFSGDINLISGETISYLDVQGNAIISNSVTGLSKNSTSITVSYANPANSSQQTPLTTQYVVPKTVDIDFSTKRITQQTLGTGNDQDVYFDFFLDLKLSKGSVIINAGPVTLFDNGNGVLSGTGVSSSGSTGTVDYDSGSIVLEFENPPLNGVTIACSYTYFTPPGQGDTDYIVQKFKTDVEYYQVITASTYSEFLSLNPPVLYPPAGQISYNNNSFSNNIWWNSLNYRYIGNFMSFFRAYGEKVCTAPFCVDYYYYDRYAIFDALRPIIAIPDYKDYVVVFLMKGVDPHSARIDTEIDLSRLYGKDYGQVKVRGNYKLNIPIQPNLVLPRHNELTNNESVSQGGNVFFPSYAYQPTSAFSGFTTNLISNYSSLDRNSVNSYRIENSTNTTRNTFTTLTSARVGFTQHLSVGTSNGFAQPQYVYAAGEYTPTITTTCQNNDSYRWYPGGYCNNGITLNYNQTGLGKQHRGYYTNEYIEGGSYFYFSYRIDRYPIGGPTGDYTGGEWLYFSPVYNTATTTSFLSSTQRVVMRSDRLPTSTNRTQGYGNNSYILQQNDNFSFYILSDDGQTSLAFEQLPDGYVSGDGNEDGLSEFENQVQNSFSCEGLVPLGCYDGTGENLTIKPSSDKCYDKVTIENGCFKLITTPLIISLGKDYNTFKEYKGRFRINFGACRGLFGHSFYNNWVNGVLFAFPFKNNRFFTSPSSGNRPYNVFCEEMITLHTPTNNFYYRSSPYNIQTNKFIGKRGPSNGRNSVNLLYPTTITNLGPRDEFASQVTLSPDYFGYNMDKYQQTSYQDVENLLNLFIISRLVSGSGSRGFFKGTFDSISKFSINQFFNARRKNRVDGDYAQAISINSELGVDGFDFETYEFTTNAPGGNTYYLRNKTMGVFFSSDTQSRDYLSPRRIIRNDDVNPGVYDNLGFKSQEVPFYSWNIVPPSAAASIFGTEKNEWATTSADILSLNYQSLDRINSTSDFYIGEIANIPRYSKGYIYNVAFNTTTGQVEFEGDIRPGQTITNTGKIHVGAPYHFYFGLYRGSNALDLFNKKYLGGETI